MADNAVVGILKAILRLDTADFESGAARTKNSIKGVEQNLGGINSIAGQVGKALAGAFTVGAIVSYGKAIVTFADNIGDLSDQTGISTSRLQALNYVMAGSGVSVDQLATGVAQLSKNLIGGDKGAAAAVRALGLNLDHLITLSPDDAFIEIGQAVARIPDPMERSAIMMELFGRNGAKYLKVVSEDMRAVVESVEKTGPIIDKELIAKAGQFEAGWERAKLHFMATTADMIGSLFSLGEVMGRISFPDSAKPFIGPREVESMKAAGKAADKTAEEISKVGRSSFAAAKEAIALEDALKKKAEKALQDAEKAAAKVAQSYTDMTSSVAAANSMFHNAAGITQMNADLAILQASTSNATRELMALANVAPEIEELSGTFELLLKNQSNLTEGLIQGTTAIVSQEAATGGLVDQQIAAHNASIEWREDMAALSDSFLVFAQIAGDSLGQTLRQIGAAIAGIELATSSVSALKNGFQNLTSGSILKGLAGIVGGIGGIASAASAAISVVSSLIGGLRRLFGGGEEGVVVNPARDKFWDQYGGYEGASMQLTRALEERGDSDPGGTANNLVTAAFRADTKDDFDRAQDAIISLIGGQRFHGGGEVPATLLPGERVLSIEQNKWFSNLMDRMPSFDSHEALKLESAMGDHKMYEEIQGLRADMRQSLRDLPLTLTAAMKSAVALR